jgi:L-2-hydroxyglutarate oxidase LhgO
VATREEELGTLASIEARGRANGVVGLRAVGPVEVARLEPALRVRAGLLSAETGIVDAHRLCASFAAEAESRGAQLLLHTTIVAIEARAGGYRVEGVTGDEHGALRCAAVVNAAGLASDAVAALVGLDVDARGYRLHPCKGDYFALAPGVRLRLTRPVYPVPSGPGLGIHATPDLGGRLRFGPDAEYVATPRYDVDPAKAARFARVVSCYLPAVDAASLVPEGSGVRPRLAGPGEPFRDFVVAEESAAGLPGFVNLIGIESPGLTAAPAIAERVAGLLASL